MAQSSTDRPRATATAFAYGTYAFAVLATAIWAFGIGGIVAGIAVSLGWGFIFRHRRRPLALVYVSIVVLLWACFSFCLLPAVQQSVAAARRTQCRNNLKVLGIALHNYQDAYGSFPPSFTQDSEGLPLLSWRVLLLPYVDEGPLYTEFHLNEPWDSPHNFSLLGRMPSVYRCPASVLEPRHHGTTTSYVAVVGTDTAWTANGDVRALSDFTDGVSTTLLVIESHTEIPWTAPDDLPLEDALQKLTSADPLASGVGHLGQDFLYDYCYGRMVLFADGHVAFAENGVDRETWLSLLQINDGGPDVDAEWNTPRAKTVPSRPRIGNWIRLSVFLAVALFPLPWVWFNPTSGRDGRRRQEQS